MKRLIAVLLFFGFVFGAVGQVARPSTTPRWDRLVGWVLNGQETLAYKTLSSPTITGPTLSGTLTGNVAVNGKWTIGANYPWTTSSKITADSLDFDYWDGNTSYKGKLTIAANYPMTTSSKITADSIDVDYLDGNISYTGKMTIAADYPFVSNSTVTVDSLVTPRIAGVANATEVKSKLTIAANYPLVSSSGVTADSLTVTAGNMTIIDIDSVATAGGVLRWYKVTFSKAGATGKPAYGWFSADTSTVK